MEKIYMTGTVVQGKQMGRELGFPTANIQPDSAPVGAAGVYAGQLDWGEGAMPCVVNIGSHPTLPEGPATVEAHVPGFSGNIYGCSVQLTLERFLRPEKKFCCIEELKAQLREDVKNIMPENRSET